MILGCETEFERRLTTGVQVPAVKLWEGLKDTIFERESCEEKVLGHATHHSTSHS